MPMQITTPLYEAAQLDYISTATKEHYKTT